MSKCRIVKSDDDYEVQSWVPGYWDVNCVAVFETKKEAVEYAKETSCPENPDAEYDVICVVEDGKIV